MGVLNSSRKAMKGFIEKSYSMGQLHGEMKKINDPRRQNLIETVHLTKAEENKIDTLFVSTYGKKIKYDWHRLYQSFTGKFDENYFPEYLFSSVLEPKLNPMDYRYVLDDKLLLPLFCVGVEHVRTPRTYYSVCDGICFDEEKNIVDELWPDLQKCLAQFSPIRPDGGAGRRSCAESSDLLQREEREEVSARRGVRLCPVGQPEGHRTFY